MDGQIQLTKRNVVGNIGMLWFYYPNGLWEFDSTMTEKEYWDIGDRQFKKEGAIKYKVELTFMVDTVDGFLGDNEYTIHQGNAFVQLPKKGLIPGQFLDGFKKLPLEAVKDDILVPNFA